MSQQFTIVIPTRERADTLRHTLSSVVAQDYDNLTILVSDNASTDSTCEVVRSFSDSRLQYINPRRRLSMAAHFEFALSHVRAGYVATLGDDDALPLDGIVTANEILRSEEVSALTSTYAQYDWPGMANGRDNQLLFTSSVGYETRETRHYLPAVLHGHLSYHDIPIIYQGFVRIEALEKLKALQGRIFLSNQLDMYSAVALSHHIPTYLHSRKPLFINGTSSRSNGASHFGQTKDQTEKVQWKEENDLPMLPPFEFLPSIKLLLAESVLQFNRSNTASPIVVADIAQMLRQAYAEQLTSGKADIAAKISGIAEKLGVKFGAASPRVISARMGIRVNRFLRYVSLVTHRPSILVDCAKFDVHDIAGAARLMHFFQIQRSEAKFATRVDLWRSRLGHGQRS